MTSLVTQQFGQVELQISAHVSRAREAVHDDVSVDPMAGSLFDHAMVVERSSLKKSEAFGFSQVSISMLRSLLEALVSIGLILLSKMIRVLFYPLAHHTK
jgi:hypothetical protein